MKKRILIVEDKRIVAENIKNRVEKLGYQVSSIVSSGEKAIRAIEKKKPDLVLMDTTLQCDITGVSAGETIQSRFQIPVVYRTSFGNKQTAKRMKQNNAFDFVLKPFDDRELPFILETAFEKSPFKKKFIYSNPALQTIQNVNRLIRKEKNLKRLLKGACHNLIQSFGFSSAWIVLLNNNKKLHLAVEAGDGGYFKKLVHKMKKGDFPNCIQKSLSRSSIQGVRNPELICHECLLSNECSVKQRRFIRLEYDGKIYGLLSICLTEKSSMDKDACTLFEEFAEVITYGIYSIEMITERKQKEEALKYRVELERLITTISSQFINLENDKIDQGINETLELVGKFVGVDRSYVFILSEDGIHFQNTHEWTADGLSPRKNLFQELSDQDYPCALRKMRNREVFHVSRLSDLHSNTALEKKKFHDQGIRSILNVPMEYGGSLVGFVGFDSVQNEKNWDQETIALLRIVAEIFVDTLERKRIEQALIHERDLLQTLMDDIPDAIYFKDKKNQFTRINRALTDLFGLDSSSQAIGKTDFDFFPKSYAQESFIQEQKIIKTGESLINKMDKILMHDREIWISSTKAPIRNNRGQVTGIVGISRNVSDIREAEETIRQERDMLNKLINNIPDSIYFKDSRCRFVRCNRALLSRFGLSEHGEIIEKTDFDYFEKAVAEELFDEEQSIIKSGIPLIGKVYQGRKPESPDQWFMVTKVPVTGKEGKVTGIIGISREITSLKKTEEKLIQTASQLQHTTAVLKRYNADLEQFAYVASHDLQEPLRMVASYVQLLKKRYKDRLDSDANDFIDFAVDGAHRMQTLINDLLAFSRIGSKGKSFEDVDCSTVLDLALASLKEPINGHTIERGSLPIVKADGNQLVQLFKNLVDNSIKFHNDGKLKIQINAERQNGEWLFSIKDNGIGIDPQYAERIFVIFQRLHNRAQYTGTGIGLAVCKRIVERHGGRIWVESEIGRGATFYFTIPDQKKDLL